MLAKIEIKKLFGIFNYTINLERNKITIITGPNGYGKSTILKLIYSLYNSNIFFFANLDFSDITFYNEKGQILLREIPNGGALSLKARY